MTALPPQYSSVDYTGLAATAWELFSTDEVGPDDAFFRAIIEQYGEPALDIGCGSGRLLLPMLGEGVDIEGVEPSAGHCQLLGRWTGEPSNCVILLA